jgi:hypothetical protein
MANGRIRLLAAASLIAILGGCATGRDARRRPRMADALRVEPASPEIAGNRQLKERLAASPHGYFRFVNIPFSRVLCRQLADVIARLPEVNLHGDAHVEQYAVTSLGRGLTDFDDSSLGPPVIDLVRFGVSLQLAARAHDWRGREDRILDAFFRGYRTALQNPSYLPPPPRLAEAIRATFTSDHAACLARGEALMEAVATPRETFEDAARGYVQSILDTRPELSRTYFSVKKHGTLRLGIGSALGAKFLLRVEGPTPAPDDDVLIEVKEVRDLSEIGCVVAPPGADRVLAGHARFADQPFPFPGFIRYEGRVFWLHAWTDDYEELSVDDFQSWRDLEEIALDAGAQLGRGQPRLIPRQRAMPLQHELVLAMNRYEGRIRRVIDDLTDATVAAWLDFRLERPRVATNE